MVTQTSDNRFGMPTYIVSSVPSEGTHTTLQGALADYSSGDRIGIKAGTYTEDAVLPDGVVIYSLVPLPISNKPHIIGKLSCSSGTATISGLRCETNGDYCIETTSTGVIEADDCDFVASDHDGINFAGGGASWNRVTLNVNMPTYRAFVKSTTADVRIRTFSGGNGGSSTTASTVSNGVMIFEYGGMPHSIATSGSGRVVLNYAQLNCENINSVCLTTVGTGTNRVLNSQLSSGTAACISIGSGTTVEISGTEIDSTNSNPITGAGTVIYGSYIASDTGQGENVTTRTRRPLAVGSISFDGNANRMQNYAEGTFTPTVIGTSTAGTATYGVQVGNYTRIGREVLFRIAVAWSGGTGTGNLRVTGLPFTVNANNGNCAIACNPASTLAVTAGYDQVTAFTVQNTTQIQINEIDFNTASGPIAYDGTGSITFTGNYYV